MTNEEKEQLTQHSDDVVSNKKNENSHENNMCKASETTDIHEAIDRAGCGLGSVLCAAGTFISNQE